MKRLVFILALMMVGMGLMATPTIDWHGRLMYGLMVTPQMDDVRSNFSYSEVAAHIALSDFVAVDIKALNLATTPSLSVFAGTVQLGKFLGIADVLDPVITYGMVDTVATEFVVSGYIYEELINFDPAPRPSVQLDLAVLKALHLKASLNPATLDSDPDVLLNAWIQPGPFNFAASYWTVGNLLGFDGGIRYDFGWAKGSVDAQTRLDPDNDAAKYGLGVITTIGKLTADWSGQIDQNGPVAHGFGFYYGAAKWMTLALGVQMVADTDYFFDSIEPSALFTIGQARIRVGYLYNPSGAGTGMFYAPGILPDGPFVKFDISW